MGDRNRHGTSFLLTNPNLIETSVPGERVMLIRLYPKSSHQGGGPATASGSGSGFFVSPTLVATNYHVVSGSNAISVHVGSQSVDAEIIVQDQQNDLALLKVRWPVDVTTPGLRPTAPHCLAIGAPEDVRTGDRVYSLGYPLSGVLGSSVNIGEGIVNSVVGLRDDPRMFQISVPIQPGSSGSPLLNAHGLVIGIVTSTLDNGFLVATQGVVPQNVNFAMKSSYLKSLLEMAPGGLCDNPLSVSSPSDPQKIQENCASAIVRIETTR